MEFLLDTTFESEPVTLGLSVRQLSDRNFVSFSAFSTLVSPSKKNKENGFRNKWMRQTNLNNIYM